MTEAGIEPAAVGNGVSARRSLAERPRILVVDDDPNVPTFVRGALGDERFSIDAVSSGEEALERVVSRTPDLIILDVVLPGQSGLEVLRLLHDRDVGVPVIVITSHASMKVAIDAMKEGAYDLLMKPLRVSTLTSLVSQAVGDDGGGGEPFTPPAREPDELQIVGGSPAIIEVCKTIGRVAESNVNVLIVGESGTGKELAARVIHGNSRRRQRPFLAINCAAIPEGLLESELFGHERGAFTGAVQRTLGKFERGSGGTVLLDEIGDMSLALQSKILRVLEERTIERVGGGDGIPVDVRIIAATNRDLEDDVERGDFREDLYYRLAVVRIELPPLRDRSGDVRPLVDHFVARVSHQVGRKIERIEPEVYVRLETCDWAGNIRELRNVLERALILGSGPTLRAAEFATLVSEGSAQGAGQSLKDLVRERLSLEEVERLYIEELLEVLGWNYTQAATVLGVHRNTLRRKIRRYGVTAPD